MISKPSHPCHPISSTPRPNPPRHSSCDPSLFLNPSFSTVLWKSPSTANLFHSRVKLLFARVDEGGGGGTSNRRGALQAGAANKTCGRSADSNNIAFIRLSASSSSSSFFFLFLLFFPVRRCSNSFFLSRKLRIHNANASRLTETRI